MVLLYPASALLEIAVVLPRQWLVADSSAPLSECLTRLVAAPTWAVFPGYAAFTTTFWLTLLLGALGGYVHESARTESTASR